MGVRMGVLKGVMWVGFGNGVMLGYFMEFSRAGEWV